jgi:hypothetical protein
MGHRYVMQFNFIKNHKISNNSRTNEATGKITKDLESSEFWIMFDACLTQFKNIILYQIKICHQFLVTTKLLGVKHPH